MRPNMCNIWSPLANDMLGRANMYQWIRNITTFLSLLNSTIVCFRKAPGIASWQMEIEITLVLNGELLDCLDWRLVVEDVRSVKCFLGVGSFLGLVIALRVSLEGAAAVGNLDDGFGALALVLETLLAAVVGLGVPDELLLRLAVLHVHHLVGLGGDGDGTAPLGLVAHQAANLLEGEGGQEGDRGHHCHRHGDDGCKIISRDNDVHSNQIMDSDQILSGSLNRDNS